MTNVAFAILVAAAAGCAPAGTAPEAPSLDEAFGLRVGASAHVAGTSLEVGFVGVSGDSRCPKDVQCVWEGDATVRIRLGGGEDPEQIAELHTAQGRERTAVHGEYGVRLQRLDPRPLSERPVEASEYCAILEVTVGGDSSTAVQ